MRDWARICQASRPKAQPNRAPAEPPPTTARPPRRRQTLAASVPRTASRPPSAAAATGILSCPRSCLLDLSSGSRPPRARGIRPGHRRRLPSRTGAEARVDRRPASTRCAGGRPRGRAGCAGRPSGPSLAALAARLTGRERPSRRSPARGLVWCRRAASSGWRCQTLVAVGETGGPARPFPPRPWGSSSARRRRTLLGVTRQGKLTPWRH